MGLEAFEDLVRRGEVAPNVPVRFAVVTGDEFVPAAELEIFRGLYSLERIAFQREFNLARFPFVTVAVTLINVAVFLLTLYLSARYGEDAPLVVGAKAAPLIDEAGQAWRLFTFNFVHADRFHLLANVAFLMLLGLALENAFSRRSFLLILLASGLASGLSSYLLTPQPAAGASGLVFGVLGGLIVFGIKYRGLIPRRYAYYFGWSVTPLLAITVYTSLTQPLVDHAGHIGGLLGGALACALLRAEVLERRDVDRRAWARAFALIGLCALALAAAGPVLTWRGPKTVRIEDDLGLGVTHPEAWSEQGYDVHGDVTRTHKDYPFVVMTLGSIERPAPRSPRQALDNRVRVEIDEAVDRDEIHEVLHLRRSRLTIGGHDAEMLAYTYVRDRSPRYRELYVVTRGRLEHVLAFETLLIWQGPYAPVFADVLGSVELTAPSIPVGSIR